MGPEYNDKIKVGALLAPPAYMTHSSNPIFIISSLGGGVQFLYHLFGMYEFLPHMDVISWIAHLFCGDFNPLGDLLCGNIAFLLLGFNPDVLNSTMIPTYLDNIPEGTSTRPFVHYAQLHLSGKFEAYDWGPTENVYRYNQTNPLNYDLSKVTAPTAIFKGDADDLVDVKDVERLVSEMPNVIFDHLMERGKWTHTDFAIAMDADTLVYQRILDIFSQY